MIKQALLSLLMALFTFSAFAQDFKIKDFSLRDYKAPDIKYRRLDLGGILSGSGIDNTTSSSFQRNFFNGNINIAYREYLNSKHFQGQIITVFFFNSNTTEGDPSILGSNQTRNLLRWNYADQNRWYNDNNKFFGLHTLSQFSYQFGNSTFTPPSDSIETKEDFRGNSIDLTLYLSGGSGRIEPVAPARRAMDILISLEKYDRLALNPNPAMIDSLARIANRIQYKRFFDRRFKRVYQLKELDKGIQDMGLVDNPDMVYAANLTDIWNFAWNFNRGTGNRWEYGLIPIFHFWDTKSLRTDTVEHNDFQQQFNYGIYGFGSWNHMVPLSYKWQSDIMIDISAGWQENDVYRGGIDSRWSELINMSWSLGYYPNTRTYMGITPYSRVSFRQGISGPQPENNTGLLAGFDFRSYFYVSPRFRISASAGITYSTKDFDQSIPMPYWNTSAYINPDVAVPNLIVSPHLLNSSNLSSAETIRYNFFISLSYAIL